MNGGAMDIDVTPVHVTVTGEPFDMTAARLKAFVWTDCIHLYSVRPCSV